MDRVTVETMPSALRVPPAPRASAWTGGTFHGERLSGTVLEGRGRKAGETKPFQGVIPFRHRTRLTKSFFRPSGPCSSLAKAGATRQVRSDQFPRAY